MDEQNEATYGKPCDWNELKVQLNNVTLMHGPASVTLAQAEEAMLRYIGYLVECESANSEIASGSPSGSSGIGKQ